MTAYSRALIATLIIAGNALMSGSAARADSADVVRWIFNIDGTIYDSFTGAMDATPVEGDLIGGLGSLTWGTTEVGAHSFIGYFDCDLVVPADTFPYWENEFGWGVGTPVEGQAWEVDEPYLTGDIVDNVLSGQLDNSVRNAFSIGDDPFDVAVALGWEFELEAGEEALVTLHLVESRPDNAPGMGFYLVQTDPFGLSPGFSMYFYSTLEVIQAQTFALGGGVVPEPATVVLIGLGIAGFAVSSRFRRLE